MDNETGRALMNPAIHRLDLADEYCTDEGCYITEVSNSADDEGVSIARARLDAGKTTRWHRLDATAERYVILQGRGRVEIGALPAADVAAGDVVLIPPMCRQRITNSGADDLVFLAICTPRFSDDAYQDIEDNPDQF